MRFRMLFATASLLAAFAPQLQSFAQTQAASSQDESRNLHYTVTDLGIVGGPPGQPFHITNNDIISGSAAVASGTKQAEQAVLWFRGWKLNIGTPGLGGKNSVSFGVNQWGQAAGEADTSMPDPDGEDFCGFGFMGYPSGTTCLPMVWQDGVMTALPLLQDKTGKHGNNGVANGINKWGEIAGVSENTTVDKTCPAYDPSIGQSQNFQQKPAVWQFGRVLELPTISGEPDGILLAINDNGASVGTSGTCAPFNNVNYFNIQPVYAVLWEYGRAIDLGSLGGMTNNLALAIDNHDDVVGFSDMSGDTTFHGFLWKKETGKMQDLAPVGSDVFSVGLAVNDARGVTGVSLDADFNPRAVLWRQGAPVDLNTLISGTSGLTLLLACSINDSGQIIGVAVDSNGDYHGYLATPSLAGKDNADAAEAPGPVKLPQYVREQVSRQLHFSRFTVHSSTP